MAKVFDCFPFFNELEVLEIRLHELAGVVDRFVLVEATRTFSGAPKPLHFLENRDRFSAFADRIEHVIVDDDPDKVRSAWDRRTHQCNALRRGLGRSGPDDLIVFSDVDEIPRAEAVRAAAQMPLGRFDVLCFELRMFNYYVNYERNRHWLRSGPRAVLRRDLPEIERLRKVKGPDCGTARNMIRAVRNCVAMGRPVRRITLRDAGWHFTYLGGIEAIRLKLQSFAGHDVVPDEMLSAAAIAERIDAGRAVDIHEEDYLVYRPLDDSFPQYLRKNCDRFSHLILKPKVAGARTTAAPL